MIGVRNKIWKPERNGIRNGTEYGTERNTEQNGIRNRTEYGTERRGRRSLRRIITIFFPFYRIFVDITPYIIIMLLVFNYFIIK